MKKLTTLHLLISVLITAGLLSAFSEKNTVIAPKSQEVRPKNGNASASPLEGAWLLVWGKYGDNIRNPEEPYQIKLFTDSHYSLIMDQGTDNWGGVAGIYTVEGNTYKETVQYSTIPEYVGYTMWWNYEIRNDTLWMTGPLKVLDKSGAETPEVMGGYGHMKEARVRAE